MSGYIAVVNAGSSSIKFALCDASNDTNVLFRGQIEAIGVAPKLHVKDAQGKTIEQRSWPAEGFDHKAATREILATGSGLAKGTPILGVGHRIVHGGMKYGAPVLLNQQILADLAELIPLAPLHQPHNLGPVQTILEAVPHIPQIACFDTAFHRSQENLAQSFALPRRYTESGVRRYGFHGLSYEYIVSQLLRVDPAAAAGRAVLAHLGNGASLCAVHDGKSVASTMGFTAVDGLVMGTRCGALDPGVILYLLQEQHLDAAGIEDLIYRKSGLLGVSGISSDMRTLRASSDPPAREAIALFVYRIVREVGSLVAALGGIDALVFSGGIGEHDATTRAEVVSGCSWLGAIIDPQRNAKGNGLVSADISRLPVWVVATDEERLIARQTRELVTPGVR
jgi:acetate kinase